MPVVVVLTLVAVLIGSDHTGVEATIDCPTTDAQRAAAPNATVPPEPTTTTGSAQAVDAATLAAITDAYHRLFDGDVTDTEEKVSALEDSEVLRQFFLASYDMQREVAAGVRVGIDSASLVDPDHADVTYTLL